jgi:hypothetical protein
MSAVRRLRNSWILWVTTVVLACFSNAVAQEGYRVFDLGTEGNDILGCAMSLNNEGWTEIMAQNLPPPGQQDSLLGTLLNGRILIDVNGFKFDLGTLGGTNTTSNWGEINDFGQVVGDSETAVPDPNGEDICGFGTHLTCRPFLWQFFHMRFVATPVRQSIGRSVAEVARTHPKSNLPANAGEQHLQRFGLVHFGR